MNNLEEILKIIELLQSRAIIDIKINGLNKPSQEAVNLNTYLTFSKDLHEYVMVCIEANDILNIDSLMEQSKTHFVLIENNSVQDHYPIPHDQLSPLNIIDKLCRSVCSIIMFSNSLTAKDVLVGFTHSEGQIQIPFMELKIILEVSGAKIRQFTP